MPSDLGFSSHVETAALPRRLASVVHEVFREAFRECSLPGPIPAIQLHNAVAVIHVVEVFSVGIVITVEIFICQFRFEFRIRIRGADVR